MLIEGHGAGIDRLDPSDALALAASHSDPDNARFQSWRSPLSVADALAFISEQEMVEPFAAGSAAQYAIRDTPGGPLLGDLYVDRAAFDWQIEVGITLVPGQHGRGLATAALCTLIDAAFSGRLPAPRIHRIVGHVDIDNVPSRRLFERVGFRLEGRLARSGRRRDGSFADELVFGLTADAVVTADAADLTGPDLSIVMDADPHPGDLAFLDDRLYEFNAGASGHHDGELLAAFVRDRWGRIVAGVSGHTWGGAAEVRVLWVSAELRGAGLGTRLLAAFEAEARRRGVRRVFLSSHSFQAPAFYERLGYVRTGEWRDYPDTHSQVFLAKQW